MTVKFTMEKETKNTIKFAEVLPEEGFPAPKIGSVYIPKSTLGEIGWKGGEQELVLEVKAE